MRICFLDTAASCSQLRLTPVHVIESANCTYCPQVKFGQGSKKINDAVLEMHKDPAVKALRNEHGADLVQMVGYWGDPKGDGFG